jgi:hypothetical protein
MAIAESIKPLLDPTNRATIDMAEWIYGTAD